MILEAKRKATEETGLKKLAPKQMLQRIPIKKITKKVYNNIIESIKV